MQLPGLPRKPSLSLLVLLTALLATVGASAAESFPVTPKAFGSNRF